MIDFVIPPYREALPSVSLRSRIRCYWTLRTTAAIAPKRILPDGCADLLFEFTPDAPSARDRSGSARWIGTMTRAMVVESCRTADVFGVRFAPGALYTLMGEPLHRITDASVALDVLQPSWTQGLPEALAHCGSFESRCAVIDARLCAAFMHLGSSTLLSLLEPLERSTSLPSVSQLAIWAGTSERSLQRRFMDAVGVSPKQHLRWLRFERAVRLLRQGGLNGADIACELLYSDQSHFIGDFRRMAGVSPSRWIDEAR